MKSVRNIILISVCLAAGTIILSCKKNKILSIDCNHKSSDINIVGQLLVGTWRWNSTLFRPNTFPPNPILITPVTEGYNQRLVFKEGEVGKYKNDSLLFRVKYEITYLNIVIGYQPDSSVIVVFKDLNSGIRQWFSTVSICNDTTIFYNPFYDNTERWSK